MRLDATWKFDLDRAQSLPITAHYRQQKFIKTLASGK